MLQLIDQNEVIGPSTRKSQILEVIRRFRAENGRIPTCNDFKKKNGFPSRCSVEKYFGSWNNAIKEAGYYVNRMNSLIEEELLDYLEQFEKEHNRPATIEDLRGKYDKYPALGQYIRCFGTLENARKLVCQDTDTLVMKGITITNKQKARLAEIFVIEHFIEDGAIDLAGENCNSHVDGTCPKKQKYDVKSSSLLMRFHGSDYYGFHLDKGNAVDFYYLLAFNHDYSELMYVWRVPWNFFDGTMLHITIHHIEKMKKYEITDKFKDVFTKYEFFNKK